jgi:ribonuclease I
MGLMGAMLAVFWSLAALAQPAACLADGACETAEYCKKPDIPTLKGYWALALSWQPAFCETHGKNGCPVECRSPTGGLAFSLHGLWPQWAEYCEVPETLVRCSCAKFRGRLPEVTLSEAIDKALTAIMPGKQSRFDRHEWTKHGTCSGLSQNDYFATASVLTEQANQSGLRTFIADNVGKNVTYGALCRVIEASFGPEAAKAVEIEQTRVIRPDGNKIYYLTGLRFWLKPVNDNLTLSKGNFVTVEANWQTLGGRKARPMCAEPLTHSVYIDKPGLGQ